MGCSGHFCFVSLVSALVLSRESFGLSSSVWPRSVCRAYFASCFCLSLFPSSTTLVTLLHRAANVVAQCFSLPPLSLHPLSHSLLLLLLPRSFQVAHQRQRVPVRRPKESLSPSLPHPLSPLLIYRCCASYATFSFLRSPCCPIVSRLDVSVVVSAPPPVRFHR